jgi:amidohydrolase
MQNRTDSEFAERIAAIRRDLHRIPEAGFQETKTSAYVAEHLERLGLVVTRGLARTGVSGLLQTGRPGPTLLIRADMDGLHMQEETGLSFASSHPGMMHACGHDGHMAMLLGAAELLCARREDLCGRLLFVFQPAEEGPGGALPMIQAGILDNPRVDYALACHLWPDLPKGSIGVRPGPLMAAMDRFEITILGQTGHAAMPHLCIDALDTGVQVVSGLQRLISRQTDPLEPAVLSIGSFQAGSVFNVLPGKAVLGGTTRTFDKSIWQSWKERIERVVQGVCASMGASYQLSFTQGFPPLQNDPEVSRIVQRSAAWVLGQDRVLEPRPTMGGEDMAYVLQKVPGCYFFVGIGEERPTCLHNPGFTFDDAVLGPGAEVFCQAAMDIVHETGKVAG